jgi:hypothetical protein
MMGAAAVGYWQTISWFGMTLYTTSVQILANLPPAAVNFIAIASLVVGVVALFVSILPFLINNSSPTSSDSTDPSPQTPSPNGPGSGRSLHDRPIAQRIFINGVVLRMISNARDEIRDSGVLTKWRMSVLGFRWRGRQLNVNSVLENAVVRFDAGYRFIARTFAFQLNTDERSMVLDSI